MSDAGARRAGTSRTVAPAGTICYKTAMQVDPFTAAARV